MQWMLRFVYGVFSLLTERPDSPPEWAAHTQKFQTGLTVAHLRTDISWIRKLSMLFPRWNELAWVQQRVVPYARWWVLNHLGLNDVSSMALSIGVEGVHTVGRKKCLVVSVPALEFESYGHDREPCKGGNCGGFGEEVYS